MPLFRALAKNMAPMTNADESPTNRLTLFPIYLSLFIVYSLTGLSKARPSGAPPRSTRPMSTLNRP